MKRLLALSLFGLVLWLTLSQTSTVEAKRDGWDEGKSKYWIHLTGCNSGFFLKEGKCKPYEIEDRDEDEDGYKNTNRFLTGCNTGFFLKEGKCKKMEKEKFEKPKKIRWNEFNDDLNKIIKFLKPDLDKAEKKEVWAIISKERFTLKGIYSEIKSKYQSGLVIDMTGYVSSIADEFNWLSEDLMDYIDTSKATEFQKFISNKISLITRNLKAKINKKK